MLRLVRHPILTKGKINVIYRFNFCTATPVKQDSFFDKVKRWSKRLSPLIAFSFVSTFVIGNLSIRHFTESIFPSYVQFLRDNYGFADEDPVERARVAAIEANNAKAVTANIWLENGECIEHISFPGTASYAESVASIEAEHKSKVIRVEFNDSIVSLSDESDTSEGKDLNIVNRLSSMLGNIIGNSSQDVPRHSDVSIAATFGDSEVDIEEGGSAGLCGYAASNWDDLHSVNDEQSKKNSLLREINTELVLKRYENIIPTVMFERSQVDEVRNTLRVRNQGRTQLPTPSISRSRSIDNATAQNSEYAIEKHQALQTISRLETKIEQCKKDMQSGARDMDSANADIQAAQSELTSLKRKYVNMFYYF